MIKVALVSHTNAFAGAERMLFNLACLLQKDPRFEPIVFLPGTEDKSCHFYQACDQNGIPVIWINMSSGYHTWYVYTPFGDRMSFNKQTALQASNYLKNQLVQYNIDLVITNTATNLVSALSATALGIPLVTWIHGIIDNASLHITFDAGERLIYDRILMALSSQVICCSDWTRAFFEPLSCSPIATVHNWCVPRSADKKRSDSENAAETCDHAAEDKNSHKKCFVCLSTFEESKGVFVLLRAAKCLKEKRKKKDWYIKLYGDGSPQIKEQIAQYIEEHELKDYISIEGRVLDVDSVYRSSFCLLQPSFIDSFGMTIIEAMSNEAPVIATRSGGPAEIIADGETGYLIDRNDAKAMAERMQFLLECPETAKELGQNGRKRFEECFSEKAAEKGMLPLLESVVKNHSGVNPYQQLVFDMTMHQLKVDAGDTPLAMPVVATNKYAVPYNPDALCFSGALKKPRRYQVSAQAGTLSAVGILLANLGEPLAEGSLTMRVYQKGKLLGETALNASGIKLDNWTYFNIPAVPVSDAPLVIEVSQEGFDELGVFEVRERRGFFYKVFNKLGHPLKGKDVLQVALIP